MLTRYCYLIISTIIMLPFLVGAVADIQDCCLQDLSEQISISKVSLTDTAQDLPSDQDPLSSDCQKCCSLNCVKVFPLNQTVLSRPTSSAVICIFSYNFPLKSINLTTPQKPPLS